MLNSYVVENTKGEVTDFCSFYHVSQTILGHPTYRSLRGAYSFYNVATSVPLKELMNDALILAKQCGCDVFNCLDIQENQQFLEPLKFGIGTGELQYYLFNWRCRDFAPQHLGLVLI